MIHAIAKLGELLKGIDKSDSKLRGSTKGTTVKPTLPPNISKKQSHYAQAISGNLDVAEQVIASKIANMPKHLHKTDRQIGLSQ